MRLRERADARLEQLADLGVERAHADLQTRFFRDHVGRMPGVEGADGHHGGLHRIDAARHDGLQRGHQCGADHDRVDRQMRSRRMAAAAVNHHVDRVARRHERSAAEHEGAGRIAGVVVQAEDRLARKALEQAVFDHAFGAAVRTDFLGGLEHQMNRAVEAARAGQMAGCAQHHRRVTVVTACVHQARFGAGVGQAGLLVDRQSVHVGAHGHRARSRPCLERGHHAGATQAARHGIAPAFQTLRDEIGGLELLIGQFRMAMEMMANAAQFVAQILGVVERAEVARCLTWF